MILPSKHNPPDRALLTYGGIVLQVINEPKNPSAIWEEFKVATRGNNQQVTFDIFVMALDLLFMLGAVSFEAGLLRKRVNDKETTQLASDI